MVEIAKRRGRPPRHPDKGTKVGTINFRVHDAVRARIAEAAADAGRSVTEDVEYRVAKSVRTEEEAFGGPETYRLMLSMAQTLQNLAQRHGGAPWHQNPSMTWDRIAETLGAVYTFDAYLLWPRTAEEDEEAAKPIPSEEESEAEIINKSGGKVRFATAEEMETSFDPPSLRTTPVKRPSRKITLGKT